MTVSSPRTLFSPTFRRYHRILPRFVNDKCSCNVLPIKRPWASLLAAAVVGIVLLFVLMKQTSSPDTVVGRSTDRTFVRNLTFNCSDLGLHKQTVMEQQQYHVFPTDVDLERTCQSKYQQHCFLKKTSPKFFPTPKFLSVLRDYEAYHARCAVGNLTDMAVTGDVPADCKYLVWKAMDGMGNQLISLVCAFIYSLLTKRVMLIATDSHIDVHLCNPFPLSSWVLPDGFPEPTLRKNSKRLFVYLDEVWQKQQRSCLVSDKLPKLIAEAPKHIQVFIMCCDNRRDHQFFCPTAQKLLTGVNWMFYHSHEYTLPAFYFVPEFRKTLKDWFPKNDGFMHGARYILNPENDLWFRITQLYKEHMDGRGRQVGFQVRSWHGDYLPAVSRQVLRCAIEKKLLPQPLPQPVNSSRHLETNDRSRRISVQVASLRAEYSRDLASAFANHSNSQNSSVNVFSTSNEVWQHTGDRVHDGKAIIDIWLLSFAHDLVITPLSTFGSSASGLAGIKPFLFNHYQEDVLAEPACERTNVVGPCFLAFPHDQPCDLDPARSSIFNPDSMVPEVKYCTFNHGLGMVSEG